VIVRRLPGRPARPPESLPLASIDVDWHGAPVAPPVTYALAVRTVLPAFITRGAEQESLTETITAMRKLAEQ